jgi:ribonuclease P protein component
VGTAPERNKVRRRLKAIFYEEKLFDQGYDCVVIVKKPGVLLTFDQWKQLLIESLSKPDR